MIAFVVLPSIPEVPDYEHLQLQQRNSQQQQQHGSEMSNESEKKDPELLVDIGAEDNISGLVRINFALICHHNPIILRY